MEKQDVEDCKTAELAQKHSHCLYKWMGEGMLSIIMAAFR